MVGDDVGGGEWAMDYVAYSAESELASDSTSAVSKVCTVESRKVADYVVTYLVTASGG